jgi:IS30 family transposase
MSKKYRHLSAEDRGAISVLIQQGQSIRSIAAMLHRSPSTISRELKRNGWRPAIQGKAVMGRPRQSPAYEAERAGNRARRKRHLPRSCRKLQPDNQLWAEVRGKLDKRWSPQQIARHLKRAHPTRPSM